MNAGIFYKTEMCFPFAWGARQDHAIAGILPKNDVSLEAKGCVRNKRKKAN